MVLLGRKMLRERTERDLAEDVGGEPLLSILLLESLLPIGRCELENALGGPARQETEEVAQVGERLEAMQLTASQEGDEGGVHLASLIIAQEEPVAPAHRLASQLP